MPRRDLLGLSAAVAAGAVAGAPGLVGAEAQAASSGTEVPVTPPEDLMQEHGVLKRVLLVYREVIRRIDIGDQVPAQELHRSAQIIRRFIEEHHEELEEQYVFPRLREAGRLVRTVDVLVTQHDRGREITRRILDMTGDGTTSYRLDPGGLRKDMAAFIRMYEPHEAREDTVVFPALREVVSAKEFNELGDIFEEEEHRRFGANGFKDMVEEVAGIEKSLGIYELSQFTPKA
ncbi:hemerythrin domain-containing protein [Marinitenerispora sediminis]|uniref:hemerythrin domain-containing protein n=1 Tax=Marinitenerispora sediminis TaxID=1931232 RepID=UPI001F400BAF|nr:hemerythrin domain-containing protein [Marinitenerispora sediminis]